MTPEQSSDPGPDPRPALPDLDRPPAGYGPGEHVPVPTRTTDGRAFWVLVVSLALLGVGVFVGGPGPGIALLLSGGVAVACFHQAVPERARGPVLLGVHALLVALLLVS